MRRILAVIFWVGVLTAGDGRPAAAWTVHTHPAVVAGVDPKEILEGAVSPSHLREAVNQPDLPLRVQQFVELCITRGISQVILDGFQPELGGIYFESPYLQELGWKPVRDVLQILVKEAKSKDLKVGLVITELGIQARGFYEQEPAMQMVRPLPREGLARLLAELSDRYSLSTVLESEFPAEWYGSLREAALQQQIRYVHQADTDDIVSLTGVGQRTSPIEAYASLADLGSRDFHQLGPGQENGPSNGSFPLLFEGHSRSVGTSSWFGGELFMRNLVSFRSLQIDPEEIILLAGPADLAALPRDLISFAAELQSAYPKDPAILNLVVAGRPQGRLDAGHSAWLQLAANLDAIVLGGQAAGMQLRITDKPLPQAAAHYLYLAGPTPAEWLQLETFFLENTGTPLVVQIGSAIEGELLMRVAHFLGVDQPVWKSGILPSSGVYRNEILKFAGGDLYEGRVPTGYLDFRSTSAQILMTTQILLPLIVRHPEVANRFLINGNLIHRQLAYPLSQMITDGRGLQAAADCLIAVGTKTAFWALEDSEVDWIHPRTGRIISLEMKKGGFYVAE